MRVHASLFVPRRYAILRYAIFWLSMSEPEADASREIDRESSEEDEEAAKERKVEQNFNTEKYFGGQ